MVSLGVFIVVVVLSPSLSLLFFSDCFKYPLLGNGKTWDWEETLHSDLGLGGIFHIGHLAILLLYCKYGGIMIPMVQLLGR